MLIFTYIDKIDRLVSSYFFSVQSPELHSLFGLITLIGNTETVLLLVILVTGLLYHQKKYQLAFLTILAVAGSTLSTYLLKFLFARSRPEFILNQLDSFSLPSGHATGAMALCGALIYISAKLIRAKRYVFLVTVLLALLIFLIGFSRIYLGYHYLSDVIADYGVGLVWLLFSIALFKSKSNPPY